MACPNCQRTAFALGLKCALATPPACQHSAHLYPPRSPQIQPIAETLAKLGFKRSGETQTQLPFGEPGITWILTNPYHREQAADFSMEHGPPSRVEHMTSHLRCDAVYRLRYVRRTLRRYLWAGTAQLAALGYTLVTLLAFISLSLIDPSRELVVQRYWRMILQLALAALISGFAFAALRWHGSRKR